MIITLLFGTFAAAQTIGELAELARRERARRTAETSPAEVYTTESLATRFQRVRPEVIAALDDLGIAVDQVSSDFAGIASDAARIDGELSGSMTEMFEAVEAEALREISRLRVSLANPVGVGNRAQVQAELVEAEQVLSEVRAEMAASR